MNVLLSVGNRFIASRFLILSSLFFCFMTGKGLEKEGWPVCNDLHQRSESVRLNYFSKQCEGDIIFIILSYIRLHTNSYAYVHSGRDTNNC
jgi:hypothetical protein